ncbi:MAG: sensor histidine kinase [Deltaproteobacteria bacterium]|nr:sensor histidine kinase [Deltaproteobacteria bacterium]
MKSSASAKAKPATANDAVLAAVLEERQRISRELHDRALQLLSTARLRIERCYRQADLGADELKAELAAVEENLDRSITEIRNILSENQLDDQLQAGSLERRLKEELKIFSARAGFKIDFQCAIANHNLPTPIERELYFALREGVLNAIRHSRATELQLSLAQNRNVCEAKLRDNGVGFAVAATEGTSHYGLKGMRERIRKIGGELSLQSAPGRGTEIRITVPLE